MPKKESVGLDLLAVRGLAIPRGVDRLYSGADTAEILWGDRAKQTNLMLQIGYEDRGRKRASWFVMPAVTSEEPSGRSRYYWTEAQVRQMHEALNAA